MKKKLFLIFLAAAVFISGCIKENTHPEGISGIDLSETQIGINGENIPVIRGYAAKMASFLCGSRKEINLSDAYMDFADVDPEEWYGKYINYCYKKGIIKGTEEKTFSPKKNLTLSEAQYFVNSLDKSGEIKIHITEESKDKPISLSLWNTIYEKLISANAVSDIKEEELSVFADSNMYKKMPPNYVITNNGVYCCDGIDIASYENCIFKAYTIDRDIISITHILDKQGYCSNAYIKNAENNEVSLYLEGAERKFRFTGELFSAESIGKLCDVYYEDENISECTIHESEISGIIKYADDEKAEISSAGTLKYDPGMKIFLKDGETVYQGNISDLTIGKEFRFILENGKIRGIIGEKNSPAEEIYLHIKNGTSDYFGNLTIIKDGSSIAINPNELNERTIIEPASENLKIKTDAGETEISGRIEIANSENGILLTNIVTIEEYTESLTAKKATPDMNDNMLDTMAIISRTEAVNSILKNGMSNMGASAENIGTNTDERIKAAAERTKGKIITYHGEPINPMYFKSSCGNTASNGELWPSPANGKYPWDGHEYLKPIGEDLSDNSAFKAFIANIPTDLSDPWQRWHLEVNISDISAKINSKLPELCRKYENYTKAADPDGIFRSRYIGSIGEINDILVTKRGKGGNAEEIEIKGSGGIMRVATAPAISFILSFDGMNFSRADSSVETINTLPSVFFDVEKSGDIFVLQGGGFGHGAGLSVSDAQKLSESMGCEEIIKTFYRDSEIS